MGGKVVNAIRGERRSYLPIASPLCPTANPLDLAHVFLELYPFDTLYIADLDAILRQSHHLNVLKTLRSEFPTIDIWVDGGVSSVEMCKPLLDIGLTCVVGSESLQDIDTACLMIDEIGPENIILSLDYAGERRLGPAALFEGCSSWPARVIAMTLARVGSHSGPDWRVLEELQERSGDSLIYAAGGVRHAADLFELRQRGFAGALLASALHQSTVTRQDLEKLGS